MFSIHGLTMKAQDVCVLLLPIQKTKESEYFWAKSAILKEWNMFQIFSCHLISICF